MPSSIVQAGVVVQRGQDLSAPVSGDTPKITSGVVQDTAQQQQPSAKGPTKGEGGPSLGGMAEAVVSVVAQGNLFWVYAESWWSLCVFLHTQVDTTKEQMSRAADAMGTDVALAMSDRSSATAADTQATTKQDDKAGDVAHASHMKSSDKHGVDKKCDVDVRGEHHSGDHSTQAIQPPDEDKDTLQALLNKPPPEVWCVLMHERHTSPHIMIIINLYHQQGFEDPIAKLPMHPEPATSLHLPGEEDDRAHPMDLPQHLDRDGTEAAAHAPLHPGDQGDTGKLSFAAVAAKLSGD